MMCLRLIIVVAFLSTVEITCFSIDTWHQKANFGGSARHRCTAFSIGNKGYIGLGHINAVTNILYADFWEYDPASNTWTQKADFGGGLRYHSVGFTIGTKAYVGTGRKLSGGYENDLWEFDPIANTWTEKTSMPNGNRRGAVSFVINGIGYVGSGEVSGGAVSNDFYGYNPLTDSWSQIASFPGATRTSAVAFTINNIGYFGTGGMGVGTNDFWQYDPILNLWSQLADVGPTPRQEAVGFSINGKGYIGTGDDFSSGNNFQDMWEFDPAINQWNQIEDFPGIARRYMVAFVIGNKVFAGVGTNGTNFRDFWEFDKTLNTSSNESFTKISIYPNPVASAINIELASQWEGNVEFQLYHIDGKFVFAQQLTTNKTTIERDGLPAGIYFYSIISDSINNVQSGQLILE